MWPADLIEDVLERYDNEDREWVVRWRLWLHRWFPYRTAEVLSMRTDEPELILGDWEWNAPKRGPFRWLMRPFTRSSP